MNNENSKDRQQAWDDFAKAALHGAMSIPGISVRSAAKDAAIAADLMMDLREESAEEREKHERESN